MCYLIIIVHIVTFVFQFYYVRTYKRFSLPSLANFPLLSSYSSEVSRFNTPFRQTNTTGFAMVPKSSTMLTSSSVINFTPRKVVVFKIAVLFKRMFEILCQSFGVNFYGRMS